MTKKSNAAEYLDGLLETIRENVNLGHPFGYDLEREEYGEPAELSAYDWMEDVLDIDYVVSSQREFKGAHLLLSYGGPNTWLDTQDGKLAVHWGSDTAVSYVPREFVEGLNEVLSELWAIA